MACSKSLVCRLLPLRGKLIRVSAGSRVGSYHCIISFCALLFFCRWLRRPVLSWTEVPVFPSPRAVQPIQPAESPPHGQNYSLTPTAPLPPPSLPPFLQTCFSLETTGMGTGRGERLTKGKKRLKPERRIE